MVTATPVHKPISEINTKGVKLAVMLCKCDAPIEIAMAAKVINIADSGALQSGQPRQLISEAGQSQGDSLDLNSDYCYASL
jgi:hypothetical protein